MRSNNGDGGRGGRGGGGEGGGRDETEEEEEAEVTRRGGRGGGGGGGERYGGGGSGFRCKCVYFRPGRLQNTSENDNPELGGSKSACRPRRVPNFATLQKPSEKPIFSLNRNVSRKPKIATIPDGNC